MSGGSRVKNVYTTSRYPAVNWWPFLHLMTIDEGAYRKFGSVADEGADSSGGLVAGGVVASGVRS